jgi:hypothetical protein
MRKNGAIAIAAVAVITLATAAAFADHRGGRPGEDREEMEEREGRGRAGRGEERDGEGRALSSAAAADPAVRALYRKECAACHLDFPPQLLPASSHRRILAGLDRHFGQNAELDPAVRDRLEKFLVENAADAGGRPAGDAPLRICEQPWFRREHAKAAAAVPSRPSIGSLANCAACHPGAKDWDFGEDRARIPPR